MSLIVDHTRGASSRQIKSPTKKKEEGDNYQTKLKGAEGVGG